MNVELKLYAMYIIRMQYHLGTEVTAHRVHWRGQPFEVGGHVGRNVVGAVDDATFQFGHGVSAEWNYSRYQKVQHDSQGPDVDVSKGRGRFNGSRSDLGIQARYRVLVNTRVYIIYVTYVKMQVTDVVMSNCYFSRNTFDRMTNNSISTLYLPFYWQCNTYSVE